MLKHLHLEKGVSLSDIAQLDTMVTVVDAKNFLKDYSAFETLKSGKLESSVEDERTIANLLIDQIEFSDVLILNKIDLVTNKEQKLLNNILKKLNSSARVVETKESKVSLKTI